MKVEKYNEHYTEYSHNGVTFRCPDVSIVDALTNNGINLFSVLEKAIDNLVLLAKGNKLSTDFSVRTKITKDYAESLNEISYKISVEKLPRWKD